MKAGELIELLKQAGTDAEILVDDQDGRGMIKTNGAKVFVDLNDKKKKIVAIEVYL